MKRVWIDHDACVSCGLCVTNIPEVFRFGSDGKAEVFDSGGAYEEVIESEAIDICPVSCIYWQE